MNTQYTRSYKLDIIYARVSTDEQAGEGKTSLGEQEQKCRDYLAGIGCKNTQVFREDYSGFEFERPELDKIRALIKAGKVRSLTFLRVDRLSRQSGHLDQLRSGYFIPSGIEVHSVSDLGKWEWTPSHIYLQNTLVNFSQFWGNVLTQILKDGKIGKVKKGDTLALGRAPFGFKEIKDGNRTFFVIAEEEARIIRLIFRLLVNEGLSLNGIAKRLNAEGIPTYSQLRGGTTFSSVTTGKWYRSALRWLLRNPAYKGEWLYGKNRTVKDYDDNGKVVKKKVVTKEGLISVPVPVIIEPELWEKAQELLDHNRVEKRGRQVAYEYLLSRRITCACGRKMRVWTKDNGRYMYYACPRYRKGEKDKHCPVKYLPAELVDFTAWEWVSWSTVNKDELLRRIQNYRAEREKALEPIQERLSILDQVISRTQARYDKLLDLYLDSTDFTKEMLEGKQQSLEKTLEEHKQERAKLAKVEEKLTQELASLDELDSIGTVVGSMETEIDDWQKFEKRRERIERIKLKGTLIIKDDGLYLHVCCTLKEDLLQLYSNSL